MNNNGCNATPSVPVSLQKVQIHDEFWAPKLAQMRTSTLDDVFNKFEKDGAFGNFDRVARGERGGHKGAPWFDGLIYETIRAASDFLAANDDARLDARLDGYIERIAAAQKADPEGYINTYISQMAPEKRWGANGGNQLWSHEEYDAGCLFEAGVHHYLATKKTNLLEIAVRFADYLTRYIGEAPKHNVVPSHSLPEEALLKLYWLLRDLPEVSQKLGRATGPGPYLDLARFWIDHRGDHRGRIGFTEYAQDHKAVVEQEEAVGHSVRGTLLYTGLAALAAETGDPAYTEASLRLWQDAAERKMYITGGVGPIKEYEGFGYGYYLPDGGYAETCAGVGMAFWAYRMGLLFKDASYADVFERIIYNIGLAGISLDGCHYSYQNPLRNKSELHRWVWHPCPCCPPMLLKLMAGLGDTVYAQDGQCLYVNQYLASTTRLDLPEGEVGIEMQTRYPWDGAIAVHFSMAKVQRINLHLRIPGWCQEYQARVNGEAVDGGLDRGYLTIDREWQDGDHLDLNLAMPAQLIAAHPFVHQLRDRVAIQRGPVVYCLEGIDNPGQPEPVLAAQPQLAWSFDPGLLGGVVRITGVTDGGAKLEAVPYYAWDNRPAGDTAQDWMTVWVRRAGSEKARQVLDQDDRKDWQHNLYRPLSE